MKVSPKLHYSCRVIGEMEGYEMDVASYRYVSNSMTLTYKGVV